MQINTKQINVFIFFITIFPAPEFPPVRTFWRFDTVCLVSLKTVLQAGSALLSKPLLVVMFGLHLVRKELRERDSRVQSVKVLCAGLSVRCWSVRDASHLPVSFSLSVSFFLNVHGFEHHLARHCVWESSPWWSQGGSSRYRRPPGTAGGSCRLSLGGAGGKTPAYQRGGCRCTLSQEALPASEHNTKNNMAKDVYSFSNFVFFFVVFIYRNTSNEGRM